MVSCGNFHTMTIDENGVLWACGFNREGQLGFEVRKDIINKLEQVPIDNQFVMVRCGHSHTMTIDKDGFLWGCGSNDGRQLGFADKEDRYKLEKVPIENPFLMVSCGTHHTIAIDEDGGLWVCGLNKQGQLCSGDHKSRRKLEKVTIDKRFIMISCGRYHTMGVEENGCLYACGDNELGQLGFKDVENRNRFEKVETTIEPQILMNTCLPKKKGLNTKGAHMIQES